MTQAVKLTVSRKIYRLQHKKTRIFSLQSAHLINIFTNTPIAKEFIKWVLDILNNQTSNPKYQPHPKAVEHFSHSDTRNLTHLVSCMTNGLQFKRSSTNAVWLALREVTGTPSPQRFQVEHIPLIGEECSRIYYITDVTTPNY
ncbi:MAG: hypothetical protein ACL7BU_06925 [Candidatus Phlomobacter fragariae]